MSAAANTAAPTAETVAPHIRGWNIGECWRWSEWPDRDEVMPEGTPSVDVGIDLVARRRDDVVVKAACMPAGQA